MQIQPHCKQNLFSIQNFTSVATVKCAIALSAVSYLPITMYHQSTCLYDKLVKNLLERSYGFKNFYF